MFVALLFEPIPRLRSEDVVAICAITFWTSVFSVLYRFVASVRAVPEVLANVLIELCKLTMLDAVELAKTTVLFDVWIKAYA